MGNTIFYKPIKNLKREYLPSIVVGAAIFYFCNDFLEYIFHYENYQKNRGVKFLMKNRKNPFDFREFEYITRKKEEKEVNNMMESFNIDQTLVILGPIGSGKSQLVNHVANGKDGIIFIDVTPEISLENRLLSSIDVYIEDWNIGNFILFIFRKTKRSFCRNLFKSKES